MIFRRFLIQFKTFYNQFTIFRNRRFLERAVPELTVVRPIFIIGPPRCGSTLFYQAMVHCFRFCYFTNQMMKHPLDVAYYINKNSCDITHSSSFTSHHGRTTKDGQNAPHEGWPFWRRFYPRLIHDYIDNPNHLQQSDMLEIKRTLQFITSHYRLPFLSKNMEIGLRLRSISHVFPNSIYIIIKRDPRAIASSLLQARIKDYGNPHVWWSMRPVEFSQLSTKDFPEQLAGQILGIYRAIYSDLSSKYVLSIFYEDFCDDPKRTVEETAEFLIACGIDLTQTNNFLPRRFQYKKTFSLSSQDLCRFVEALTADYIFSQHLSFRLDTYRDN